MTPLAALERAVRQSLDFTGFEDDYLHRASREDAWGRVRGRDRIRDLALTRLAEEPAGEPVIEADCADGDTSMIAFATEAGWRGHRWAVREDERIAADIEVLDGAARCRALGRDPADEARRQGQGAPVHAPLGELRPGRGQLANAPLPVLPPSFPLRAQPGAAYLHALWNRRDLSLLAEDWRGPAEAGGGRAFVLQTLATLPDAVWMAERGITNGNTTAILWRLHGHHLGAGWGEPSGRRIRAIGSSVLTMEGERVLAEHTMIDTLAMQATAWRPLVDYGG